jgi:hypothetical protein
MFKLSRPTLGLLLLALLMGSAAAQDGEWIDLETLREATPADGERQVEAAMQPMPGEDPAPDQVTSPVLADPTPNDTAADSELEPAADVEEVAAENPPPLNLPRSFRWQGREAPLGRVGYVYLGDFYLVEERDFAKAETCYLYALEPWPDCGPIQTRLELLSLFTGDWLHAAESMQVSFGDGVPPRVIAEYGIDADTPILSNERGDVPAVPAMHFRLALAKAQQVDAAPDFEQARTFLVARLLSYLGETELAISTLSEVALDEMAEPWNFQAASQRAALYLDSWRPELAYVNLLRAKELVGEHPLLMDRLADLREQMTLRVEPGRGDLAEAVVRILGRQDRGRWILSAPGLSFAGQVEVAMIEGEILEMPGGARPHLLYRGRDYWVMTLPLGQPEPDWKEGMSVTLTGPLPS